MPYLIDKSRTWLSVPIWARSSKAWALAGGAVTRLRWR
jgi:hypothetical protein